MGLHVLNTALPCRVAADVWAPEIATHYGEVFWTDQGTTPIPPEIVKRFEGAQSKPFPVGCAPVGGVI